MAMFVITIEQVCEAYKNIGYKPTRNKYVGYNKFNERTCCPLTAIAINNGYDVIKNCVTGGELVVLDEVAITLDISVVYATGFVCGVDGIQKVSSYNYPKDYECGYSDGCLVAKAIFAETENGKVASL